MSAKNRAFDTFRNALPQCGCYENCGHADTSVVSEAAIVDGINAIDASADPLATAQAWIAENVPGGAA